MGLLNKFKLRYESLDKRWGDDPQWLDIPQKFTSAGQRKGGDFKRGDVIEVKLEYTMTRNGVSYWKVK